jgi:hypothetical protein
MDMRCCWAGDGVAAAVSTTRHSSSFGMAPVMGMSNECLAGQQLDAEGQELDAEGVAGHSLRLAREEVFHARAE